MKDYFKKYFFVFYLFGQSAYNPFIPHANTNKSVLVHIPRCIIFCVLLTAVCNISIIQYRNKTFRGISDSVVFFISLGAFLFTYLLVVLNSFVVPNGVQRIIGELMLITKYLKENLNVNVVFQVFEQNYLQKIRIFLCVLLTMMCVRLTIASNVFVHLTEYWGFIIYAIKYISVLHIVFYIDFVTLLLHSINIPLAVMQLETASKTVLSNSNVLVNCLRYHKYVHFKLWQISKLINFRFGWIMMGLLLSDSLDISFTVYWMFLYGFSYEGSSYQVLRK